MRAHVIVGVKNNNILPVVILLQTSSVQVGTKNKYAVSKQSHIKCIINQL